MFLYHHCRSLEYVVFGTVRSKPEYDNWGFEGAYSWLEKEVGFYPIFLAVGTTDEDIRMTGYQNQWKRIIDTESIGKDKDGSYVHKNILKKKGEFENHVLVSYTDLDGVFMDYDYWHYVLNASHKNYQMTDYEKRLIFKPSWSKSKWLGKARKTPHSVQLVTPELNLSQADRIWVRNQQTRKILISMGFEKVEVRKLTLEESKCN